MRLEQPCDYLTIRDIKESSKAPIQHKSKLEGGHGNPRKDVRYEYNVKVGRKLKETPNFEQSKLQGCENDSPEQT